MEEINKEGEALDQNPDTSSSENLEGASESTPDNQGVIEKAEPSFFAKTWEFVSELLHVVAISLAIIVPVRIFLIQPFYVKGASMEPNFHDHEYLIIDEISYRFGEPTRGDIVVFKYPNDPGQYFIKRVIGLPGERIKLSDGKITVTNSEHPNGLTLDESGYLDMQVFTSGNRDLNLAEDEYFLMGDNRPASLDSRSFGPVKRSFIIGRVWLRGWPPEKAGFFGEQSEVYK